MINLAAGSDQEGTRPLTKCPNLNRVGCIVLMMVVRGSG